VDLIEDFLNLLLPSACILCKTAGSNLCEQCQLEMKLQVRKVSRQGISGFATTSYTAQVANLMHEFKEAQQTSLAKIFSRAMLPALENFELQNCSLVYMPSKAKSFASRGFVPAKIIANGLSRQIAKHHKLLVPVYGGLGFSSLAAKQISDQAALSGRDRRTNLVGTMQASGKPLGSRAILIDDIVTTGATLTEAARALGDIGVQVLGFVTFAETLPKNQQKGHEKSV
jgi:ComF family protein